MTTAEIFAQYLALTPEGSGWAFTCGMYDRMTLTATSPLAEKPTPGWCEALILGSDSLVLYGPSAGDPGCVARLNGQLRTDGQDAHPTRAVALALLAADPDLRARCEQASDASEVLP